ncbi:MAG TPA: DUF3152 domain-containing protein [Gaiellaceae bacterium]|nr:DUF3152 domain-containing protein [Gaiellaceae bacterium]
MRRLAALVALAALVSAPAVGTRPAISVHADAFEPPRAAPGISPGAAGELRVVPGRSARSGAGPVLRYAVEVEGGLRVDPGGFALRVDEVLAHPRGWGGTDRVSFRRVSSGPFDFRVTLASPETTDRLCAPLETRARLSCARDGRAVLNALRWEQGAQAFGGDLARYRAYLVNHEVGHLLGHGHRGCPAPGVRAPVMMQQTKGVGACRANPLPLQWERG